MVSKQKPATTDETYTGRYLVPYDNGKPESNKNNTNLNIFIWVLYQTKLCFGRWLSQKAYYLSVLDQDISMFIVQWVCGILINIVGLKMFHGWRRLEMLI